MEIIDIMDQQARKKGVVSGYLIAFDDLRVVLQHPLHQMQLAGQRTDANQRSDLIAECPLVQFQAETANNAVIFQPSNPVCDAGRGQIHLLGQIRDGDPGLPVEGGQNLRVDPVKGGTFFV